MTDGPRAPFQAQSGRMQARWVMDVIGVEADKTILGEWTSGLDKTMGGISLWLQCVLRPHL